MAPIETNDIWKKKTIVKLWESQAVKSKELHRLQVSQGHMPSFENFHFWRGCLTAEGQIFCEIQKNHRKSRKIRKWLKIWKNHRKSGGKSQNFKKNRNKITENQHIKESHWKLQNWRKIKIDRNSQISALSDNTQFIAPDWTLGQNIVTPKVSKGRRNLYQCLLPFDHQHEL